LLNNALKIKFIIFNEFNATEPYLFVLNNFDQSTVYNSQEVG